MFIEILLNWLIFRLNSKQQLLTNFEVLQALQELKNQKTNRHLMNLSTISYEVNFDQFQISSIIKCKHYSIVFSDLNTLRTNSICQSNKGKYWNVYAGSQEIPSDKVGSARNDQWWEDQSQITFIFGIT